MSLLKGKMFFMLFLIEKGFGDTSGEHWLGNEYISKLTNDQQYVLRIELTDWDGNTAFSQYEEFSMSSEEQKYR